MINEHAPWQIAISLKKFLTFGVCPPRWKGYDLYLIRDEQVVFYVGQSQCAFDRVWEHLKGGPHGHSIVGRFLLCNWPVSGRFAVELHTSQAPRFEEVGYRLDEAERLLIETHTPCFNVMLNMQPVPLPLAYLPPNASIKYWKNFRRMLREAGYTARSDPADLEWDG